MLIIKSHVLCHLLLLLLFSSSSTTLENQTESALECGEDKSCEILAQMMSTVNKLNEKLDKQAKGLEELKTRLNKSLATISTQLGRHSADFLNHDTRLKEHDVSQRNDSQLVQSIYGAELGPRDCTDIRERGYNASGVYRVYPGSDYKRIETDVFCDFQDLGQSWLVFQRRVEGSVNFERPWKEYANGFGNLYGEFWLGNEKLSLLTMNRKYKLRVELEDFEGERRWAEYSTFFVTPVTDNYRLTVGGYSGDAGDSLKVHSGLEFSTLNFDNDANAGSCAQLYRGAWWYNSCHESNLNGLYLGGPHESSADGIEWATWHGMFYSLKTTAMKITAVYNESMNALD